MGENPIRTPIKPLKVFHRFILQFVLLMPLSLFDQYRLALKHTKNQLKLLNETVIPLEAHLKIINQVLDSAYKRIRNSLLWMWLVPALAAIRRKFRNDLKVLTFYKKDLLDVQYVEALRKKSTKSSSDHIIVLYDTLLAHGYSKTKCNRLLKSIVQHPGKRHSLRVEASRLHFK